MDLERVNKYRQKTGQWGSKDEDKFGLFFIKRLGKPVLKVICAPMESEWQHVSVSLPKSIPTWVDMCKVKNLFWNKNETVIQFHPEESEYVNNHKFCLHMWRHKDGHKTPPSYLVGIK